MLPFLALLACLHGFQHSTTRALFNNARPKREFAPSSPHCGGCLSKYAPINCRCTNVANSDELLCRCDRALVTSPREREEPSPTHCGGSCRYGAVDQSGSGPSGLPSTADFRPYGSSSSLHSACHPICHKSCMTTCTRDRDQLSSYPPPPPAGEFHHSQPQQQQQQPMDLGNCVPSQCKANCLRACARIMDAHQVPPSLPREPYVPPLSIGGSEPHYQVEPTSRLDYRNGETGTSNGCQCSPATMCDCQDSCFPICYDTCESNCMQQPQQQQRQCAQYCHLECQRSCGQEQQPQRSAKKLAPNGIESAGSNNNINGQWTKEMNSGGQGNSLIACAQKCPRACEQACLSAQNDEPSTNCLPACVGLCAQSCARGLQFDAVGTVQLGLGQPPPSPPVQTYQQQPLMGFPMPAMALDLVAMKEAQQQQNRSFGGEGYEHHQRQNDWTEESQPKTADQAPNSGAETAVTTPTVFHNDVGQKQDELQQQQAQAVTETSVSGPCAPLCQPECRPECNRRYLEERDAVKRPRKQRNGSLKTNRVRGQDPAWKLFQDQVAGNKIASQLPQHFPPHIILDEGLDEYRNVTAVNDDDMEESEEINELNNNLLWLQPQNETGRHPPGTTTEIPFTGNGTSTTQNPLTSVDEVLDKKTFIDKEKPRAKRIGKGNKITKASEFFKSRRGPNQLGADKSRAKGTEKVIKHGQKAEEMARKEVKEVQQKSNNKNN